MKYWLNLVATLIVAPFAISAFAQHDHAMSMPQAVKTSANSAMTEGIVKRIDKASGRITISHDAIVNLDMPKMTMVFRVKDSGWLDRVKEGDRIRFAAEIPNGVLTVVALDPVK